VSDKATCKVDLAKLPEIFKNKEYYGDVSHSLSQVIVRELMNSKKDAVAAQVIKKMKIDKNKYPQLITRLIEIAAITMPHWDDKFTWEVLEEVY
jgi:hypothetical protein